MLSGLFSSPGDLDCGLVWGVLVVPNFENQQVGFAGRAQKGTILRTGLSITTTLRSTTVPRREASQYGYGLEQAFHARCTEDQHRYLSTVCLPQVSRCHQKNTRASCSCCPQCSFLAAGYSWQQNSLCIPFVSVHLWKHDYL